MPKEDTLTARFLAERGLVVRELVAKFPIAQSHGQTQDGNLVRMTIFLNRPDTGDEGTTTSYFYQIEELRHQLEVLCESVEVKLADQAA